MVGLLASVVYLLTMEPTASFWDCGEFIATSYGLQIGHPPGAPLYSLLAHCFMLLSGTGFASAAWLSNALSALAGGATVMFLFWTLLLLGRCRWIPALVGVCCYLFADTVWFSSVESEVYSLSMLFSSVVVWCAAKWFRAPNLRSAGRYLLLASLLLGMSLCVHLMTLLVLPAILLAVVVRLRREGLRFRMSGRFAVMVVLLFVVGLSPYLIVPLRAKANLAINEGDPSNAQRFYAYVTREQYPKAPIYPRIWDTRSNRATYAMDWTTHPDHQQPTVVDNLQFTCSYQLGYMYFRYLLWNFSGRYNNRQGFGGLHDGQFLTGIPPIDRALLGTSVLPPKSMRSNAHNVYFMLPLLLGVLGMIFLYRRRRPLFWCVMLLFLFAGPLLALYLNMPAYEPRERDYAFVLSFFAYCIFIAYGAQALAERWPKIAPFMLLVPALMAFQNWDDHDRSHRHTARDMAANALESCEQGAILLTVGDNDTFPLWYVQQVEGVRTDVIVLNLSLYSTDWYQQQLNPQLEDRGFVLNQLFNNDSLPCPIYLSQYAFDDYGRYLEGRTQLSGLVYRLNKQAGADSVACAEFVEHLFEGIGWDDVNRANLDYTSVKFLQQYWRNVLTLCRNLADRGEDATALAALERTEQQIPLAKIESPIIALQVAQLYADLGQEGRAEQMKARLKADLAEQYAYYMRLNARKQSYISYTLADLEGVMQQL